MSASIDLRVKGATTRERFRSRTLALAIGMAALGAANAPGAAAQGGAEPSGSWQIEEMTITARRREESLQEVPVSVTAFSAKDIAEIGVTDVSHLSEMTPNLMIMPNTGGDDGTLICMRGLCRTDFTITEDPMVGIYLDGVYIGKSIGSLFDMVSLERVEVLRGPQGTLYGKNTVGGAVLLNTRKPTGELGGEAMVTVGDYGRLNGKAYLEFPVTDGLAASVAVLSKNRDPFVKNTLGEDIWSEDNNALRGAVRWTPNERFTLDYAYDWQEKREHAMVPQLNSATGVLGLLHGDNVRPHREDKVTSWGVSRNDVDLEGHGLTMSYEFGDAGVFTDLVLKSITGYRESENYLVNNAFGTTTPLLFNIPDHFTLDSTSQEFQLTGSGFDGFVDFVGGLFYFNEDGDFVNTQMIDLFDLSQEFYTDIDNTSLAAYGEVDLNFTDKFSASLGVRYTDEEREQNHSVTTDGGAGFTYLDTWAQTYGGYPASIPTKIDDSGWSPRVVLNYQWTDDLMSYVSFTRGFKSGGFNARSSTPLQWGPYDDMQVDSYEAGIKSMWLDNRLRFNMSVFYEDLSDMQAQVNAVDGGAQGGYSTVVQNAASATIKGLEVETVIMLVPGLDITAGYGYVDPEYDEFLSFDNNTGALSDISNDRAFEYTPEHSYNVSLNYTFPKFSDNGELRARIDWSGMSDLVFTPKISGNKDLAQDGYDILNLRLGYDDIALGDGRLSISGWVRNATDEEYKIGGYEFDLTGIGLGRASTSQWGEPRTYGVDVSYRFGSM
ncbi:MAG: TonB-dependent receptor [Gammaproteobacteria bacterium]|jgi:iron complex outermembrane receptor protein|nr:TonB-dependent receptor [Gammaproteobacteria bacterium]MBP6050276.1 TonB-dependent receptor [Pseudomonadales bacterium]MBK6583805.1 TonB-dependent receptor [Gammaproteobacteria bacterium]MBK7522142.1 TonB-dependent receptor [Gammaproteobacteria bacterium]MBK7727385.1 TonB-dependent receptor [Gammaproteobacteria bacterium]